MLKNKGQRSKYNEESSSIKSQSPGTIGNQLLLKVCSKHYQSGATGGINFLHSCRQICQQPQGCKFWNQMLAFLIMYKTG